MKRAIILVVFFLFFRNFVGVVQATDTDSLHFASWEDDFAAYSEVEDFDDEVWQSIYESLSSLSVNPIDINTATREDLLQIPFLSEEQVDDILYFIYRNGRMQSGAELMMIPSIGYEARRLLLNFITFGNSRMKKAPTLGELLSSGHHELTFTDKVPFYERRGQKTGAYVGDGMKHSLRYDFQFGKWMRFGIVGSKDAGEPFFGENNYGYDHYNYYFVLKNHKALKVLALGCYKVGFGMGLVVNNGLSFGKMGLLSSLGRGTNNIRPHASLSSDNYFNGLATTIELTKGLKASAFISYRSLDGTMKKGDSTAIQTIVTGGYHRTQSELNKRGNLHETTFGGNLSYSYKRFQLGITSIYSHLDKPLLPDSATGRGYKRWYAKGNDFFNIGVDYKYSLDKFVFGGETALNSDGAIATLNRITYNPSYRLKLILLQRFYSYKYNALHTMSFSEGGRVQNESGVFIGAEWQPNSLLMITAYSDWFYFPWKKYGVSESSYGTDNLVQAVFSNDKYRLTARYRIKIREKDAENGILGRETQQRMKISADYGLSSSLSFKTQADACLITFDERNWGFMLTQTMNWNPSKALKLSVSTGYFHSSNYDSRLYIYEKNMLYTFAFPSFYGEGMRLMLMARYAIVKNLMLSAKVGCTKYFDRDVISSSHQQIDGSTQTDADVQIIWRF